MKKKIKDWTLAAGVILVFITAAAEGPWMVRMALMGVAAALVIFGLILSDPDDEDDDEGHVYYMERRRRK